jgi:predicted permease
MPSLIRLIEHVLAPFRKSRFEGSMDEELHFHLESLVQENMQNGMSEEQARCSALIAFGGIDRIKEECRDTRGTRLLREILRDLHYGLRMLKKSPGVTIIAVVILALGIGANTAFISYVDAVIFRPPPVPAPDKILSGPTPWSLTDYQDIRRDNHVFSGLAAYLGMIADPRDASGIRRSTKAISSNYFQVIGLPMSAGRGFLPEEEQLSGGHHVAIISYYYWQQAFNADPGIIGKALQLNGESLTVVGVAPKNFRDLFGDAYQSIWVPIPAFFKIVHADMNKLEVYQDQVRTITSRDLRALTVFGRLKQGISQEIANSQMHVLVKNLQQAYPNTNSTWSPILFPIDKARWPGREGLFSYALFIAAGFCILLIACMNVANLLLAQGSARIREIAVRFSLGASRFRVLRQLLTEGLLLSAISVLAGLAVCSVVMTAIPMFAKNLGTPTSLEQPIDGRILLFAICLGLLTTVLFGLGPALVVSRTNINNLTKYQESFCLTRIGSRWRRGLVVLQIALSVILLVAAGLFIRTVLRFQATDIGYNKEVLLLSPDLISLQYDPAMLRPETARSFYRRSLEQIRALPGVISASYAEDLPLDEIHMAEELVPDTTDARRDNWFWCNSVSTDYFQTVGIPILRGRAFSEKDIESAPGVAIVNETMARQFWPGEDPLGKHIQQKSTKREYEVIGLAKDAKYGALNEKPMPYVYFHFQQALMTFHMTLHVRGARNPEQLIDSVRKACQAIDSRIAVDNPRTMSEHLNSYVWQERTALIVFAFLGPLSLILSGIGLYGIVSYSVARRSREFGIRIALGSQKYEIQRLVLREGMVSAILGLAIGLPLSMAVGRMIAARFPQIRSADPVSYIIIAFLCLIVSLAATLWPARKPYLNPWSSLRDE